MVGCGHFRPTDRRINRAKTVVNGSNEDSSFIVGVENTRAMNGRGFLVGCLVVAMLAGLSMGVVAVVDSSASDEQEPDRSMGEELGSFIHQSTAETSTDVDRGMFDASFTQSDSKAATVTNQTVALEDKYESIRERMDTLENDSSLPERAREAQLTRLAVELDSLNESIGDVEHRAKSVGVDTARLQTLRENASNLTGTEVAAVARNLSDVDPPGLSESGPPGHDGDRGPGDKPGDGDEGGPPGADDDEDDAAGPPDEDTRGPPGDGDESDSETASTDGQTESET